MKLVDQPIYVTGPELAEVTGLPLSTVRYHCARGVMAGQIDCTDRLWLIPTDVAERFKAAVATAKATGRRLTARVWDEVAAR